MVIGVHSAKFDNEGITENIRQIIQRYEIHHPVMNGFCLCGLEYMATLRRERLAHASP
ncbi:MAG UNVERIFIED_CONTAM: hypothetical protein LVT10_23875 [Anaerolineae bacterium]